MKNRLIISLLISGLLMVYAVPKLILHTNSLVGIFSIAWIGFALIVISGNLLGLLYWTKRKQKKYVSKRIITSRNERMRQYH